MPDREPILLENVDVKALAAVLACAHRPISHDDLVTRCDDDTIATLVDLGVLQTVVEIDEGSTSAFDKRCKRIVVGLTGAISVTAALDHVVALADRFAESVEVIISEGARRFIEPRVFEYYGMRVWTDPFTPVHGEAVPHRYLATTADLVVIAPCSANTLARLASGACSDLISLVVAITRAPVVLAPSMNPNMWTHPPIARNVAQLREDGIWVIEPGGGVPIAARDTEGVGGLGFDVPGLLRALDAISESQHPGPPRIDAGSTGE